MMKELFICSVLITVNRPPTHFSIKMLRSDTNKSHTPSSATCIGPLSDATPHFNNVTGNATGIIVVIYLSKPTIKLFNAYCSN